MINFVKKIKDGRYLSSRIIIAIDLVVSLFASLFTMHFLQYFTGRDVDKFALIFGWLGAAFIGSAFFFTLFRTHHAAIRHSSLNDIGRFFGACLGKELFLGAFLGFSQSEFSVKFITFILCCDFFISFILLILLRVSMVVAFSLATSKIRSSRKQMRVLIYGPIEKSMAVAMRFNNSATYHVVGLLKSGRQMKGARVSGWKCYYFETEEDMSHVLNTYDIQAVIFATSEAAREENQRLLKFLSENGVKALIPPPLNEVGKETEKLRDGVREIKIEDLLGRPEIKISMDEIIANFKGKVVMVTGAAGSIGSELVRQLATFGVKRLILFDNAETPMHNLRLELEENYPDLSFVPVIGDVRIERRLDFAFRNYAPQIVFHAAAYKHVPLMEENPCEAVLVNAVGSRYVADKCIEYGVEQMVMISTDKAVNPTNIMGCTKRLAEIYVQSLGLKSVQENIKTKFVTTRFGNVLGSNGSVIPRFREQIAKGGPITVTHPDITRFFMTIPEACRLVMEAATMTDGNQIFVFDMGESVKIADLARRMISLAGLVEGKDISIEFTGLRPGEKLYEEVLSNSENTIPTNHDRIRIAKVREYDYADALACVEELETLSRAVNIPDMVRLMKRAVPEFISKNSQFEQYDVEVKK